MLSNLNPSISYKINNKIKSLTHPSALHTHVYLITQCYLHFILGCKHDKRRHGRFLGDYYSTFLGLEKVILYLKC